MLLLSDFSLGRLALLPQMGGNKRLILVGIAALLVIAACGWMNLCLHVTQEDGTPIFRSNYVSRPVRLSRSVGWPRAVWVRTNWATIENGKYNFDEQMRPKESTFDMPGLVSNITVLFVLLTVTCLVVTASYDRRFSLRGLLLFTVCVAVLIVLLGPYFNAELERRRQVREFERWATEYGL
jgi:hypothetical protein